MQSVPITTNIVSLNPAHGEVFSIQHFVIKLVSGVCGFLRVFQIPSPIKLKYYWNQNPNPTQFWLNVRTLFPSKKNIQISSLWWLKLLYSRDIRFIYLDCVIAPTQTTYEHVALIWMSVWYPSPGSRYIIKKIGGSRYIIKKYVNDKEIG